MSYKNFLETPNLILREFVESDWLHIKELDSDPEVMRFLTNGIPSPDSEIDRALQVFLSTTKKWEGKFGYWAALSKESNEFVGWFHLRPTKDDPNNINLQELGYRLKRKYWGKGLATEGTKALIEKARKDYQIKAFCAYTMLANLASQSVMKKCGMSLWKEDIYHEFNGDDKRSIWFKVEF